MSKSATAITLPLPRSRGAQIATWGAQIFAAAILGQAMFFKLSGAPEAMEMFRQLGAEPFGRLIVGVSELAAAAMLLMPSAAVLGALMAVGLMTGAVLTHLLALGVVVGDDGGALFGMALATLAASLLIIRLRRSEIPLLGSRWQSPQ